MIDGGFAAAPTTALPGDQTYVEGRKQPRGCFSALRSVARNEDFILGETKCHRRNTPWGVVGLKMSRIARKQTGFWGYVVWMEKKDLKIQRQE